MIRNNALLDSLLKNYISGRVADPSSCIIICHSITAPAIKRITIIPISITVWIAYSFHGFFFTRLYVSIPLLDIAKP